MGALREGGEAEGVAGERDVALQVRGLERQLVRRDDEVLDEERPRATDEDHGAEKAADEERDGPPALGGEAPAQQRGEGDGRRGRAGEGVAGDGDVGVAGAEHGPGGARQQGVAVEQVAGGPGEQEQGEVGEEVAADRPGRPQADAGLVAEEAGAAVRLAEDEDRDQGGGGEQVLHQLEEGEGEEVEAEVVAEDRVDTAERPGPEEAQDRVPAPGRDEADDRRRGEGGGRGQPPRAQRQGRGRADGCPRPARGPVRCRRPADLAGQDQQVQESVGVGEEGGREEQAGLEQQDAPEDGVVAQRLEPEEPGQEDRRRPRARRGSRRGARAGGSRGAGGGPAWCLTVGRAVHGSHGPDAASGRHGRGCSSPGPRSIGSGAGQRAAGAGRRVGSRGRPSEGPGATGRDRGRAQEPSDGRFSTVPREPSTSSRWPPCR